MRVLFSSIGSQQRHRRSGTYGVAMAALVMAPLLLLAPWQSSGAFSTWQPRLPCARFPGWGSVSAAAGSSAPRKSPLIAGGRPLGRGRLHRKSSNPANSGAGSSSGELSDLFLQLPFNNGVWLQSWENPTSNEPQLPLLSPQSQLPSQPQLSLQSQRSSQQLTIVPVSDAAGKTLKRSVRATGTTDLDSASKQEVVDGLKRSLAPGPLQPSTVTGRALRRALHDSREQFPVFWDYELMRAAMGSDNWVAEQAESLVLSVYARYLDTSDGVPSRPSSTDAADYDAYAKAFGSSSSVAVKALELTCSKDLQLITKAHVLGLARGASFPKLRRSEARSMYGNALRFGHAVRQAETRYRLDGSSGTFVPLPLELKLMREELEQMYARGDGVNATSDDGFGAIDPVAAVSSAGTSVAGHPTDDGGLRGLAETADAKGMPNTSPSTLIPTRAAGGDASQPRHESDNDAESAQRNLHETMDRLERLGEVRPGLAKYLDWLGKYDPEALSMLVTPSTPVALAMHMQLTAVWGEPGDADDEMVATTPFDVVEAVVFGAWLRDAGVAAEETLNKHQIRIEDDENGPDAQ